MNPTYTELILAGCILILPFLYESSHDFRYRLKFFLYYAIVMVNSVILIPVFLFRPKNVRNLLLASTFCHHISTLIGLKWILRGKEYLEKDEAYVIVSNHQSSLDILGMFDFWHVMDKCTVVAKRALMFAGPFGLAAWLSGLIFIPRIKTDEAKRIMDEAADKIKQDKTKLWIFPEGTRRNTGHIHEFKKGAFHLAIQSQLPILPVVYSQYYFLDNNIKRFDQGKVLVTVLPPISTDNMTTDDVDKLIEKTRSVMINTFHEANREIKEMLKESSSATTTTTSTYSSHKLQ